jgi:hypothetical protein
LPSNPIAERIEVAGARPATFKLVEKAAQSYDLFRSGKKIGTARVEEDGTLSARFKAPDGEWSATAKSTSDLLHLVARYLLTIDARTAAAMPLNESHPELQAKGKKTADEKLSVAFLRQAQTHRIATLDQNLATMRKAMKKVG